MKIFFCHSILFILILENSNCHWLDAYENYNWSLNNAYTYCPKETNTCPKKIEEVPPKTMRKCKQACKFYKSFFTISFFISGGTTATGGQLPHMAALGFYNPQDSIYQFDCGGSIISHSFILTAAHCIKNPAGNEVKIARIGTTTVPEHTETIDWEHDHEVKQTFVHPNYSWRQKLNDIALVELGKSLHFSPLVRPCCLYTEDNSPEGLEVAGWGQINFARARTDLLQMAVLALVNMEDCQKVFARQYLEMGPNHICAGNYERNTCQGDSGGPLQIYKKLVHYVVGITSFGGRCGTRTPGVYTRVSGYLDWIESIVWP